MSELIEGKTFVDDRGSLICINDFNPSELGIERFYQVQNYNENIIRAFHGHLKEEKYVFVPRGSFKVIIARIDYDKEFLQDFYLDNFETYILSEKTPRILHIPARYANGFKALEPDSIIQFYSTSTLEESARDDYRFNIDLFDKEMWNTQNR